MFMQDKHSFILGHTQLTPA